MRRCQPPGNRQLPLHIVKGAAADMTVPRDELFGPVLPVVPYEHIDHAIAFILARPRPLALCCFGGDGAERRDLLLRTHSAGVALNVWG